MDDYPVDLIQQGAVEFVYATHVTNQQLFFVHLESRTRILDDITEKLAARYTDLGPQDKPLHSKRLGSLCAVRFTDDRWYRAKITGLVRNGLIEVHLVDYGNTDYVSEDRVKAIDPDLVMYPVQSYRCSLDGVSSSQGFWTPELIIQFEDRVVDRKCQAVFVEDSEKDEVYLVQMYDSEGSINQSFGAVCSPGAGVVQNGGVCPGDSFKEVPLETGTVFQAAVVYVTSPGLFWCQNTAFVNDILIMSEELSRLHMTQDAKPLKGVTKGTICAAKSSEDDAWYRGVVVSISGHTAEVYFVDYGNSETVSLDVLCNLQPDMRILPALGIKCCLANVEKKGREWQKEFVEVFEQLVVDKEFEVKVVGKAGDAYLVTLLDIVENKDVRLQLQSSVVGLKLGTPEQDVNSNKQMSSAASGIGPSFDVGSKATVFLSWIESPGDFWVQHSDCEKLLEEMSEQLQAVYSQKQPQARPSPGAFVVARFTQDQRWYRSLVLKDLQNGFVQVLFIDYGNSDTLPVSDLRQVTAAFGRVIPLASRCCLAGVRPLHKDDKLWITDAKDVLENLTQDGCQCEVLDVTDSHKLVRLQVGRHDVAKKLMDMEMVGDITKPTVNAVNQVPKQTVNAVAHGPKQTVNVVHDIPKQIPNAVHDIPKQSSNAVDFQQAKKILPGSTVKAFTSIVVSPGKFFIQLSGSEEELETLMDMIVQLYGSSRPPPAVTNPHIDQACVALYSDDGQWYRGRIMAVRGAKCSVLFVDYGNEDTIGLEHIRVVAPELARVPIMAYQCSLHGIPDTAWSKSAVDFFESSIMDDELDCTFVTPTSVRISCRGQDIASQLVDAGHVKSTAGAPSRQSFRSQETEREPEVGQRPRPKETDSAGIVGDRRGGGFRGEPKADFSHGDRGRSGRMNGSDRGFNGRQRESEDVNSGGRGERNSRFDSDSGRDSRFRDDKNNGESRFGGGRRDRKPNSDVASIGSTNGDFVYAEVSFEPENAILVHMDESGVFYIQLPSMEKDILFLSRRIAGSYKGGSGPRLRDTPAKGSICCAKFPDDGNMYRARIEDVYDSTALLRYVDYGNTGECSLGDLKFLFPDLLQYPVQAFPCVLRGYQWSLEQADKFAKATLDKDLKVIFTSKNCPFEVDIVTPEGDLLKILTGVSEPSNQKLSPKPREALPSSVGSGSQSRSSGFASKSESSHQQNYDSGRQEKTDVRSSGKSSDVSPSVPKQEFLPPSPPQGQLSAFISYIGQDGYFYLQLARDTATLDCITEQIVALPDNVRHPNLSIGASCAAVFSEDSSWYRALIVDIRGDILSVVFVDYGNHDAVDIKSVKPLSQQLLSHPPLAYRCQFTNIGPLSPETQSKLAEYLIEHEVTVTFSGESPPFDVCITADGTDLEEIICPVRPYRIQSIPQEVTPAGVTHIEGDGRFFLQLYQDYSAARELQNKLTELCDAGSADTIESLVVGSPCCLKVDGLSWQRGKVVEITGERANIFLVDTGRTIISDVDCLRRLPSQFLKTPPFAFECMLKGVESWNEDLHSKFVDMTEKKIFHTTFYSKTFPVSVALARSLELDLLGLPAPADKPEKSPEKQLSLGDVIPSETADDTTAYISHVDQDGTFYIQSMSRDISSLVDSLGELAPESAVGGEVGVGDVVCAMFTEDDCLYRARIESYHEDSKFSVRFIDYGNTDLVGSDRLRGLPDSLSLSLVPPFAVKCRLCRTPADLTSEQSDKLREALADQTVQVVFRHEKDGIREVDVSLDGVDVRQSLGLGIDSTQSLELGVESTQSAGLHVETRQSPGLGFESTQSPRLDVENTQSDQSDNTGCPEVPASVASKDDSDVVPSTSVIDNMDSRTTSDNVPKLTCTDTRIGQANVATNQRVEVSVIHVDSPDRFYCMLDDTKPGLCDMMDDLNDVFTGEREDLIPAALQVGDLCTTLYEDECWHRAKVISVDTSGSFTVFYIDYGNTETAPLAELRILPEQFRHFPPWAFQAKLGGIKPAGCGWTERALDVFKRMIEGRSFLADILQVDGDRDGGDTDGECIVNLLDLGIPVHEEFIRKGHAVAGDTVAVNKSVQQFFSDESYSVGAVTEDLNGCLESTHLDGDSGTAKETMMSHGAHADLKIGCVYSSLEDLRDAGVFVSHSVNPSNFWCQLSSSSDILTDISNTLAAALGSLPEGSAVVEPLHAGDVVVAVYSDDGQLYRARVISVSHTEDDEPTQKVLVNFLDYGNESETSKGQIFQITDNLCSWPAQAFHCCLDKALPVDGKWSPEACLKFSEIVANQELLLELVGIDQDGTILVDLVLRETGQFVHSLLVESGLARPTTVQTESQTSKSLEVTKVSEVSDLESLEMAQPIMESTVMMADSTIHGRVPAFTYEESEDGEFRTVKPSLHTEYDVVVSNDELPSSFHIQLIELRDLYVSLMSEIEQHVSDPRLEPDHFLPSLGDLCLVQFCSRWYRGLVTSGQSSTWNVTSLDCGWVVNVTSKDLRHLPGHFRELPAQAVPCYLAGVVSMEPEWATEAISFFMDSVRDARLCMYVLETADDGKYGVYLSDLDNTSGQSINRAMVEEGFAEVVPGSNIEVQIEMEKTLDTDMLQDLEESFNEVSQLKYNAYNDLDTEDFAASGFSSLNPIGDTDIENIQTGKLTMDTNLYHLVEIPKSLMTSDDDHKQAELKDCLTSSQGLTYIDFNFASAVDRIDKMGCLDIYPEESLFSSYESQEDLGNLLDTNVIAGDQVDGDVLFLPSTNEPAENVSTFADKQFVHTDTKELAISAVQPEHLDTVGSCEADLDKVDKDFLITQAGQIDSNENNSGDDHLGITDDSSDDNLGPALYPDDINMSVAGTEDQQILHTKENAVDATHLHDSEDRDKPGQTTDVDTLH